MSKNIDLHNTFKRLCLSLQNFKYAFFIQLNLVAAIALATLVTLFRFSFEVIGFK